MQQIDDPPYLTVGTEVSAKYKGAFCEAKVRKVVRNIKCKVAYKQTGLGSGIVSDDQIKGALRVGATVEVKHPERKEYVEATLTKIQDCSQYTVVFDDGDITTLRRSALCLKSGRHFNESETLDQLPLTHPEHFGNPVIGGRRGRRSRHLLQDDSSDEDDEPAPNARANTSDKEENIGKVVCVESTDNKRKNPKENWFPGLVVAPTAQDTVRIRVKDEYLVRSFKDGRYYTVPKKEATEFTRDCTNKSEAAAVSAALDFMDNDTLPAHWDREALFGMAGSCSDSEQELETDSSDDEPTEEKDHFVAQLYKFMDDRGTPLNKVPSIINRDVNLYRLFRAVQKLNGYNRVTSQNQWKQIALRLGFSPATASITNLVKQAYKKFLFSFEEFNRKLGCTMVPHPRTNRSKGRSLVRASSVQSPKIIEKEKPSTSVKATSVAAAVAAAEAASSSAVDESGNTSESSTAETKPPTATKRKLSGAGGGKVKALVDRFEEKEKEKNSKEGPSSKKDDLNPSAKKDKAIKTVGPPSKITNESNKIELNDRRGRKRKETDSTDSKKDDKDSGKGSSSGASSSSTSGESKLAAVIDTGKADASPDFPIEVGDKLKVYYDEQKVTYEAKVIEIAKQEGSPIYLVHYTGWNTRYDEWVRKERIAENLTNSKTKKGKSERNSSGSKHGSTPQSGGNPSTANTPSSAASTPTTTPKTSKRIRGNSKGDIPGHTSTNSPRSTTPNISSHRNKSPASAHQGTGPPNRRPVTRGGHPPPMSSSSSASKRRTSNNTDISSLSIATDDNTSDTDSDEPIKKCPANTNSNSSSSTASSNSSSSSSSSSSSMSSSSTKIRSELKGFKELKSPTSPASDSTTTATTTDVAGTAIAGVLPSSVAADLGDKEASVDSVSDKKPASTKVADGKTVLEDAVEEEQEKSSETETLSEEDSSQSSNKAFSSSPITAMVDSDTGPETPIAPPTVSTPTPTVIVTNTTATVSSGASSTTLTSSRNVKSTAELMQGKNVEKVVEKSVEKVVSTKSTEEKPSGSGILAKPPLKTYGTAAAILANAENNAVKFALSTIIREVEADKLPLIVGEENIDASTSSASTPATVSTFTKDVPVPVITKPSHLLSEEKAATATALPSTTTGVVRGNPSTARVEIVSSNPATQQHSVPVKGTKMINVQDEIVATVINKSAIAAATTAIAVSAAVSSTIPGSSAAMAHPIPSVAPITVVSTTSGSSTLAALRAEKKFAGDKKMDKIICSPIGKGLGMGVTMAQPSEKKLSSSTLTPAQNKLLSKEALSIKSIFESSATRLEDNISDVYEFKDVEFELDATTTGTTPRKHLSEVPQAEVVSSMTPALLSDEKKMGKKNPTRKLDPLGLLDKKSKKISPIKETDKLKLVRREKERDLEKEKLLLSELEGAAATFSSTMTTPEKSSPYFAGFSPASKLENPTFDVLQKSPGVSTVLSLRDEKPSLLCEEQKPELPKPVVVTKGIFTPVMSPTGPEMSGSESAMSPSKIDEKIKEEPTLENCKKYFNDMNFEFDAPKIEKPPSIADKVLKALGHPQQSHTSGVKSEFPKYIIPTGHQKLPPTISVISEPGTSCSAINAIPLKIESPNFVPILPIKTHHTEPPKIEIHSIILKKEMDLAKSTPIAPKAAPITFSIKPEILPAATCTKTQDLTESIKKLETSSLVQADSSRFTHHDEDSTDSNDSEHRLVIEDPEALDPPVVANPNNQQTDFEKLIKVEVEEKSHHMHLSQADIHSAASAAAVAAVACKERLVLKTSDLLHDVVKEEPLTAHFGDITLTKKGKQPSILETIIQSELNTVTSRGMGSHSYLKLKDQHDSFAQNELERLRREEQLQHQQQQIGTGLPLMADNSSEKQQPPQQQNSNQSESLSMLLCEETIPGSPAPVCGVSSAAAQKESTKVYVETGSAFLQPQNIAAPDLKPVPMDLEPSAVDPIVGMGRKGSSSQPDATDTPNSSPRDSVSQDENQEVEASPAKKRRQRKTSEEPSNKRRRTAGTGFTSSSGYGSRGSHRPVGSNATDSEDNSDSMAFQRGGSVGGQSSGGAGGSATASPSGKSGRPCQYNFLVNLDPALNSAQRIAILKKKIQELRKTYNAIKAELASIDRRRKKLRRRERENKKQAKLAATGSGTN
ncbi:AT-rich interactive domain-containing protein 4B isoform X2 [Sabethes cyaneus]|uniref:AT-rich interactive domain-containing protein 4B isoform X2 n=1 Tax=Sabethes cyaneus TaxID=53552 RepID=UPI00237E5AB1|nr:AT-rich interactive domain-containing protein 4B isoform X2 [Sabethes cyaneus]